VSAKKKPTLESVQKELSHEIMMHGKVRYTVDRRTLRRLQAAFDILTEVDSSFFNYHYALDHREYGGIAADRLIKKLQETFGKPWVQGATWKGGGK
jgi:hypothetical protein